MTGLIARTTQIVGSVMKNRFPQKSAEFYRKTGCLLTADVSDRLVQPEKLPDYQLLPVSILNPASKSPISNEITPSTGAEETENIRRTYSSWIIMKLVLNYPKKKLCGLSKCICIITCKSYI